MVFSDDTNANETMQQDQDSSENEAGLLDPKEVQELLKKDADNSPRGTRILTDSSKITYGRLPMFEVIIDRWVRHLSTSFRNITSDNVDIILGDITCMRFEDFMGDIHGMPLLSVFKFQEWSSSGLFVLNADVIFHMLDLLLGGRENSSLDENIEQREYTSIECNLVQTWVDVMMKDLEKAFSLVHTITLETERLESNPKFASITLPRNAALRVPLTLCMEKRKGSLDLLIPYESLEPVLEDLGKMFMGEKAENQEGWHDHLSTETWRSTVSVKAVLETLSLPLGQVLKWKVGSQVALRAKPDSAIKIMRGDTHVLTGKMGQKDAYISVQIEENHLQKRKAS